MNKREMIELRELLERTDQLIHEYMRASIPEQLPGATADDVCTPGWAREHRSVTESMRDQVYAEYKYAGA